MSILIYFCIKKSLSQKFYLKYLDYKFFKENKLIKYKLNIHQLKNY